jgi:Protein of unknown function (DUF2523)
MALIGLPLIIGSLVGGLASAVGSLVGRVLISLGITYVTYNGVDTMLEWVRDEALSKLNGLPADMVTVMNLLQVSSILNVYFSAWIASFVITGLQAGAFTKMVQRVPGAGS